MTQIHKAFQTPFRLPFALKMNPISQQLYNPLTTAHFTAVLTPANSHSILKKDTNGLCTSVAIWYMLYICTKCENFVIFSNWLVYKFLIWSIGKNECIFSMFLAKDLLETSNQIICYIVKRKKRNDRGVKSSWKYFCDFSLTWWYLQALWVSRERDWKRADKFWKIWIYLYVSHALLFKQCTQRSES